MPKLKKPVSTEQRIIARQEIFELLDAGDLTIGQAIRRMRREWTGLSQSRFGKIAGLSANTISAIERDSNHATARTLNQILGTFGMALTIRPKAAASNTAQNTPAKSHQ